MKTNENQWKPMKTNEYQWKPMKTNEYQWPYLRSYEESPKPETAVIVSLSQQLGLDPYIVRVWFTNRWQFSLNTEVARKSSKRRWHQETEGQASCQRRFGIRRCSISQSLHRRCSTWSTSFFFFYINWWSTSSSNHTGQGDLLRDMIKGWVRIHWRIGLRCCFLTPKHEYKYPVLNLPNWKICLKPNCCRRVEAVEANSSSSLREENLWWKDATKQKVRPC